MRYVIDGRAYSIDRHRIICDSGPFKGQPLYAPYFWNSYLDGTYDDERWDRDTHVIAFTITSDDRFEYPELHGATTVCMWEDRDGVVHTRLDRHA